MAADPELSIVVPVFNEAGNILQCAGRVPGVRAIDDRLERHGQADVPSLQGKHRHRAEREGWPPAAQIAAIGAGADGVILRTWVGREGEVPRVPATLSWQEAVELAERLREIGAVVRK